MQRPNSSPSTEAVEMRCVSDCDEENTEQLVIIELIVPTACAVPVVLHCSSTVPTPPTPPVVVSSTVPAAGLTQLRSNNTARAAAWRITATLAVAPGAHPLSVY